MKGSTDNQKAEDLLRSLEELGSLTPSSEWSEQVIGRMGAATMRPSADAQRLRFAAVIAIVAVANIAFVVYSLRKGSSGDTDRKSDYQLISKEFLNNPLTDNR